MAIHLASTIYQWQSHSLCMRLKRFVKLRELQHKGEDNLLLSSPKAWQQGSSHYWDSHFFNKSDKVLAALKKSQMKQC